MKLCDVPVENRDDRIATLYAQCPTRKKILLHINNDKGVMGREVCHETGSVSTPSARSRPQAASLSLLDQQADVGERVLPFSFGQLSLPRMHRAEDDAVLYRP